MKILYATDGSAQAAAAGRFLESLALSAADSVRVLSVVPRPMLPTVTGMDLVTGAWATLAEVHVQERELAERAALEATSVLQSMQVNTSTEVRDGDPASGILAAADDWGAELILVGAGGLTGLERFLLGSVARNVAKHSRLPVLVAREPKARLARVVVATDGSEHAGQAVELATCLPMPPKTEFVAAHVARPYAPFPGLLPTDRPEFDAAVREVNRRHLEDARILVGDAAGKLSAAGKTASTTVRSGDPAHELLSLAEELGAGLLIAGARGASLLEGLLVGSVADRLLKDAPCSVLLAR
jgi:nucleotide-binding universal stress UspA family protein